MSLSSIDVKILIELQVSQIKSTLKGYTTFGDGVMAKQANPLFVGTGILYGHWFWFQLLHF